MKKILLFAVMAVILFSCSKTGKKANEFTNDMENAKFWSNSSSVVKGFAHSGIYASKLDTANTFSYGFQSVFENILKSTPKKVIVTIWVYSLLPNPDASIVVDINNNGQSKFWKNSALNGVSKAKEWTEVKALFDLPANLDIKDELKIYVWNPNKRDLYIDDLNVSFE